MNYKPGLISVLVCFMFALTPLLVYTQTYNFKHYSIGNGLQSANIQSVYQDHNGYLWVGTKGGGLSRFNSYGFRNYNQTDGFYANNVYSITADKQYNIWLQTDNGIYCYNGRRFTASGIMNTGALLRDSIGHIQTLAQDNLLIKLELSEDTIVSKKITLPLPFSVNNHSVLSIDNYNRWWISADSTVYIIDPVSFKTTGINLQNTLPKDIVQVITPGNDNEMWVGTKNKGLMLLQYETDYCYMKRGYNNYFDHIDNHITDIVVDPDNNVWAGTQGGGLLYINYPFLRVISSANGLQSNQVNCLTIDTEGNTWIGTSDGGLKQFQSWAFTTYDKSSGLLESNISDIQQDTQGHYWLATQSGIYRATKQNDKLKYNIALLPINWIGKSYSNILIINENTYIFGSQNNGLLLVTNKGITNITQQQGLPDNKINHLYLTDSVTVYVGSSNGLSLLRLNNTKTPLIEHLLDGFDVFQTVQDKNGTLWIATKKGVYTLSAEANTPIAHTNGLHHVWVNSLTIQHNKVFAGTMGGGVYMADINSDSVAFHQLLSDNNLASGNIYSLLFTNDTTLLIGTDKGINTTWLGSNNTIKGIKHYHTSNSNGYECNRNALLLDSNQKIWIGAKTGLTQYNPSADKRIAGTPHILINSLVVNNTDYRLNKFSEIKLKHTENFIDFAYNGIYYSDKIKYQTYLQGHDKHWSKPTDNRYINYSNLPPGSYVFKVKAITLSGQSSNTATITFVIRPPFWKTLWFNAILLLTLIFGIIWYIRYREYKLQRDKQVLEQKVEARTAEVLKQKHEIEEQKKQITDSIVYAKRIQDAVIANPKDIDEYISEHFILYLPRDIVSGDFYWFGKIGDHIIITVADCTGHGVPGAFMSMLGIRLLNEIILERGVQEPNKILNILRTSVIHSLNQNESDSSTKDGMDMALCSYNVKQKEISFSGAYNSMWIVRNGELIEVKGDRMPIAFYIKTDDFTCTQVRCYSGDQVYLFSDGLPDQFGGPDFKKYKIRKLRELILSIHHEPMQRQHDIIMNDFNAWKGNYEQVDDISMVGIKIR